MSIVRERDFDFVGRFTEFFASSVSIPLSSSGQLRGVFNFAGGTVGQAFRVIQGTLNALATDNTLNLQLLFASINLQDTSANLQFYGSSILPPATAGMNTGGMFAYLPKSEFIFFDDGFDVLSGKLALPLQLVHTGAAKNVDGAAAHTFQLYTTLTWELWQFKQRTPMMPG